jgi:hypothetical protein
MQYIYTYTGVFSEITYYEIRLKISQKPTDTYEMKFERLSMFIMYVYTFKNPIHLVVLHSSNYDIRPFFLKNFALITMLIVQWVYTRV